MDVAKDLTARIAGRQQPYVGPARMQGPYPPYPPPFFPYMQGRKNYMTIRTLSAEYGRVHENDSSRRRSLSYEAKNSSFK
jgi:hypothetical protein